MHSGIHESRFFLSNFHASHTNFGAHHASRINPCHPLVIIRVTTSECFKITWLQYRSETKKVNFYTCSRLTFLKRKCHCGKCLKERCVCLLPPLETFLVLFWSLAMALTNSILGDPGAVSWGKRKQIGQRNVASYVYALLVNIRRYISLPDLFPLAPTNCPWVSEDGQIDNSCQTQPEIAHVNVMCVRVLCWNIQWSNISSYCWIAACRVL